MDTYVAIMDTLILAWLVVTWFYEGHHKQCQVEVTCSSCGASAHETCKSNKAGDK